MGQVKLFAEKKTHFLGFIITPDGIQANPDKIESIMKFPEPCLLYTSYALCVPQKFSMLLICRLHKSLKKYKFFGCKISSKHLMKLATLVFSPNGNRLN